MTTTSYFTTAKMLWSDKTTTVYHRKYSQSKELIWTIDPVNCLQNGHNHAFVHTAWSFSSYNPTPTGSLDPKGMSAKLTLNLDGLDEDEVQNLEQHFIDERQLALTVFFNGRRPQTLYIDLRTK